MIPYILPEYINHVSLTWLSGGYPQQHVPLLDSVHTEVGDFSSTDEESITYTKKTKVTTSNTWPRFLIISSTDDGALKKLSPFAIQKGLFGLAGEPKSVKKLKDGSLLVECRTDSHSKCLLKATSLCNIHIKVTPHPSLNTVKGVIRSRDLEGVSDDEMCENLSSLGVSTVKRIMVRRNDILVPINTFILTFRKHTLPQCDVSIPRHILSFILAFDTVQTYKLMLTQRHKVIRFGHTDICINYLDLLKT